jgi:hypothetical protein
LHTNLNKDIGIEPGKELDSSTGQWSAAKLWWFCRGIWFPAGTWYMCSVSPAAGTRFFARLDQKHHPEAVFRTDFVRDCKLYIIISFLILNIFERFFGNKKY